MKKILIYILVVLIVISGYIFFKKDDFLDTNEEILSENIIDKDIKKIALVSDIHLQLDGANSSINGLGEYNNVLIDAVLDDIAASDIDLLIMVGDNTNSGKLDQHKELINKLNKYKNNFEILMTVGNHDMGQLDNSQYEKLYKDFGFSSYYSKDVTSLSYSTIYNDLMIIILDTGGHSEAGIDPNVSKATLSWFEKELNYSKQNNLKVLCVGYHPLLTPQSGEFRQKDTIKDLLNKYDVPLYICGHLHGHSVNKDKNFFELVVEQSTSFPVSYEELSISDNKIDINSRSVDVEKYARNNNSNDYNLLEFNYLSNSQFKLKSDEIVDLLAKDKDISEEDLKLARDMFHIVMRQRSLGDLVDYIDIVNSHPGKEIFLNIAEGTIWAHWIPSVLEDANEYTKGFSIELN